MHTVNLVASYLAHQGVEPSEGLHHLTGSTQACTVLNYKDKLHELIHWVCWSRIMCGGHHEQLESKEVKNPRDDDIGL